MQRSAGIRRRPWLVPVAVAAIVMLVLVALSFGRPLARQRVPVIATPTASPQAAISPIVVPPGGEACSVDVVFPPQLDVAQFVLADVQPVADRLTVRAEAPGYRTAAVPAQILPDRRAMAKLPPPARAVDGRLCVRNDGRRPVPLVGTTEFRSAGQPHTEIDGKPAEPDLTLTFLGRPRRLVAELPSMVARTATFRGFLGASWVVWLLLAAVVAGVPLAILAALGGAVDDDGDGDGRRRGISDSGR